MTPLVVDASVLVAALVDDGPEGRWAESMLAESVLLAPQLARVEATNILRRLLLASSLSPESAEGAVGSLMALELELFPFEPLAGRIWELRANVTSYDAWYVAVAEAVEAPLATLDRRLASAEGPRCEFVLPR